MCRGGNGTWHGWFADVEIWTMRECKSLHSVIEYLPRGSTVPAAAHSAGARYAHTALPSLSQCFCSAFEGAMEMEGMGVGPGTPSIPIAKGAAALPSAEMPGSK